MNKYLQRSTATLQSQRAFLMLLTRSLTTKEQGMLRAIDAVLQDRGGLSIGLGL